MEMLVVALMSCLTIVLNNKKKTDSLLDSLLCTMFQFNSDVEKTAATKPWHNNRCLQISEFEKKVKQFSDYSGI